MNYEEWRRARNTEESYLNSLMYIVRLMNKIAIATDGDIDMYKEKMENFQKSNVFKKYVLSVVKRMVTPLAVSNMRTWRKAARSATKSRAMYVALMDEIKRGMGRDIADQVLLNASLIRTLPSDVARKVTIDISEWALAGKRATTIEKLIVGKTSQHAGASARLIARTEVSKTTTALTRARAENLGLPWYVWRTAEDGDRVRPSHRIMDDVLVPWSDPPAPEVLVGEPSEGHYHAGNIWNCRCYPEPLIDYSDIQWPHKVYTGGKIRVMFLAEFKYLL